MVLKRRAAALAAVAVLVLTPAVASCSDDGDTSSGQTSSSAPPAPTDRPADPAAAKAQIARNWTAFFDPKTPATERVKLLENGAKLAPVLAAFAGDKNAAMTTAQVKGVAFASPTKANVTYDLLVGGNPALPGAKGTSVLQDGTWKVSAATLCGLVQLSGATVPGC
ncbi:hypothetical protein ACGF1Z_32250 [Streptomyces sp. NPDC048018]|uniref:hypothetical protein n=1 Tax=Streptomyces sp. NPDC048018 TaxID=3365499 RepID=UPI00371BC19B